MNAPHLPPLDAPRADPELATARAFASLAAGLAATADLDEVLARVLEFAVSTVQCDCATIELRPMGRWAATSVTSDPGMTELDLLQPSEGVEESSARGRSVHVVGLAAGRTELGTIAFYAAHSDGFSAADAAAATLLAVHAALAIEAARTAMSLLEAIDIRTSIGQAVGIVMERYQVDGEEAFALLRRCSQDGNVKLDDIARDIVTTRQLPGGQLRPGRQRWR